MIDHEKPPARIGAVVMAAGMSARMGEPKMVLPWGDTTVIGKVVESLVAGGVVELVVVTGGANCQVENALKEYLLTIVFNPDFQSSEMLVSLQTGLRALSQDVDAALIALGDQPQIQVDVIIKVISAYALRRSKLVVPSYQMHRGHPWLLDRSLWPELLSLSAHQTLRDFLQAESNEIEYLVVDTPTVLMDLDTPEDYQRQKPG